MKDNQAATINTISLDAGDEFSAYLDKVAKPYGEHAKAYADTVLQLASRYFLLSTTRKIIAGTIGEEESEPIIELVKVFTDADQFTVLVLSNQIKPKDNKGFIDKLYNDAKGFCELTMQKAESKIALLEAQAVGTTQ